MTQPKINLNHLKISSQEELISHIAELFKKIPAVKDYYLLKLYPEEGKEIRLSPKR